MAASRSGGGGAVGEEMKLMARMKSLRGLLSYATMTKETWPLKMMFNRAIDCVDEMMKTEMGKELTGQMGILRNYIAQGIIVLTDNFAMLRDYWKNKKGGKSNGMWNFLDYELPAALLSDEKNSRLAELLTQAIACVDELLVKMRVDMNTQVKN